jgi:hypothetical protein
MSERQGLGQGFLLVLAVFDGGCINGNNLGLSSNDATLGLLCKLCLNLKLRGDLIVGCVSTLPIVRIDRGGGRVGRKEEWSENAFDFFDKWQDRFSASCVDAVLPSGQRIAHRRR